MIVSQANTVLWRERVMEVREGINCDGGLKSLLDLNLQYKNNLCVILQTKFTQFYCSVWGCVREYSSDTLHVV